MSKAREPIKWVAMDDEHTNTPHMYSWGDDWWISKRTDGWWLIVTSGVEYGPYPTLDAVKEKSEGVRGD